MTATTAKKTTNKAVKGKASSKAFPNFGSSMTPLKAVNNTMIIRPISPTAANPKAREKTNIRATIA